MSLLVLILDTYRVPRAWPVCISTWGKVTFSFIIWRTIFFICFWRTVLFVRFCCWFILFLICVWRIFAPIFIWGTIVFVCFWCWLEIFSLLVESGVICSIPNSSWIFHTCKVSVLVTPAHKLMSFGNCILELIFSVRLAVSLFSLIYAYIWVQCTVGLHLELSSAFMFRGWHFSGFPFPATSRIITEVGSSRLLFELKCSYAIVRLHMIEGLKLCSFGYLQN